MLCEKTNIEFKLFLIQKSLRNHGYSIKVHVSQAFSWRFVFWIKIFFPFIFFYFSYPFISFPPFFHNSPLYIANTLNKPKGLLVQEVEGQLKNRPLGRSFASIIYIYILTGISGVARDIMTCPHEEVWSNVT